MHIHFVLFDLFYLFESKQNNPMERRRTGKRQEMSCFYLLTSHVYLLPSPFRTENNFAFCNSRHFLSSLNWQYCDKSQYSKCTFNNTFPNHITTQSNGNTNTNTNTATRYWINKKQHVFPFIKWLTLRNIHSYLYSTISFWIYLYIQIYTVQLCRYTGKYKQIKVNTRSHTTSLKTHMQHDPSHDL